MEKIPMLDNMPIMTALLHEIIKLVWFDSMFIMTAFVHVIIKLVGFVVLLQEPNVFVVEIYCHKTYMKKRNLLLGMDSKRKI